MAFTTKAWSVADAEEAFCGWQRRVDEICDRFEDSWGTSTSPSIEAYLAICDFPTARQGALLCELLKLERELRQRQGDPAEIADYLARFPEHANVVRAVFGEIHLGTYEIISLIGEGGMGVVYRAYDGAMRRTVALKVIRSNRLDDSSAQTRFRLEAQLAARLDHECIVPVYEAGQEDGQLFYTMRYIQGRNLAEVIGGHPLECRRAARYIEQVALAVDHAHDHGILHRDVKPSNILIDDATDRAFVTDFGLAKMLDQGTGATQSTDRLGTLAYMAPEQARNPARVGIESDVYSLGATLYEAITGGPPFQADSVLTALELLERQAPTPPRKRNTRVSRDLETICLKCLQKEPHRRYSSAKTLAEDLARFRNGQPIAARRVGPIERAGLWARRNPTITALGLVTILLLGAVFAVLQARTYNAKLEAALNASDLGYKKALASVEEIALFAERRLSDRPADFTELLQIVLAEYGDYLARRKSDPRFSRELAVVLTRVARIMKLFGSSDEALAKHEEARAIRQSLSQGLPDDLTLKAELAETWHDIGILLASLGRSTESNAAYRRSLAIREYLVSRDPRNHSYSNDLARSHGYIGDWERDHGALQSARISYNEALRIRKHLSQANPSDLAAKFQLARSYNNNGFLERETGGSEQSVAREQQLEKSLREHNQAIQLQEELVKLVDQNPLAQTQLDADRKTVIKTADFRSDLAASYHARGVVMEELGWNNDAQADYENALRLLTPLVKEHSGRNEYQGNLASAQTSLAALKGLDGEAAAAETTFRRLLGVESKVTRYLAGAARSKAVLGRLLLRSPDRHADGIALLKAALKEQQRLVREHPGNFDYKREEQRIRQALSP